MNCTSCGQSNAHDMAFCIYCGSSLKPGKLTAARLTLGGGRPCIACGKADTLNSQFCIFCGTKIETNGTGHATKLAVKTRSGETTLTETVPSTAPVTVSSGISHGLRWRIIGGITIGLILGGLVGTGAALVAGPQPGSHAQMKLPGEGLVVLTKKPRADFLLTDGQRRTFLFGRTGKLGDIGIDKLDAGDYKVNLANKLTKPVTVVEDKLTVLEGPDGTELLEEEPPAQH